MASLRLIVYIVLLLVFCFGCSSSSSKSTDEQESDLVIAPLENGYSMIFFRIDDYALIYVDDVLAYDTRNVNYNPQEDLLLDLNPFIKSNQPILKIEGYNSECSNCQVNNYEFVYEIYKDGIGIDYVSEYSNQKPSPLGLNMTKHLELAVNP